jgi:hypothetical protein
MEAREGRGTCCDDFDDPFLVSLDTSMNFLSSLSSAVIAASTSALSGGGGIPGLPAYTIGDKVPSFEGKTLWSLFEGTKKVSSATGVQQSVHGADTPLGARRTTPRASPSSRLMRRPHRPPTRRRTAAPLSPSRVTLSASSGRCGTPTSSSTLTESRRTQQFGSSLNPSRHSPRRSPHRKDCPRRARCMGCCTSRQRWRS